MEKNLEWAEVNFKEFCERCKEKLKVHGFRKKTKEKNRNVVYCHCVNRQCGKYNQEIGFYD